MWLTIRLPRGIVLVIFMLGFFFGATAVWGGKGCHFVGDDPRNQQWQMGYVPTLGRR